MKKFFIFLLSVSIVILTGCQQAEDLKSEATESYDKLKGGVIETKENIEGTVEQVKDASDSVSNLLNSDE